MADLRDQLRKAGLISEKQLRQAKHKERVQATEAGKDGLAQQRLEVAERQRADRERRKQADRVREKERRKKEEEEAAGRRLRELIQSGAIRGHSIGNRKFFFLTRSGRITYLELADVIVARLTSGSAAIVAESDSDFGSYLVVSDRAANEISGIDPRTLLFWNKEGRARQEG